MNKKTITIILSVCCVAVLVAAIVLIASPGKGNTETPSGNTGNEIVDNSGVTNNEGSQNSGVDMPILDGVRKDGKKTIPVVLNGVVKGEVDVVIENSIFKVNVDGLNAAGATNFKTEGDALVWEDTRFIYTIKENSITSFDKDWEKVKAEVDATTGDANSSNEKEEGGAERTFEMPGYKKYDGKYYLDESVITFIGYNSYVNDKGVVIVTEIPKETNSYVVESALALEGLTDMEAADFTMLGEAFFNGKFDFKIESYASINSNIDNDAIKDVLFNSLNNSDNIIYSKKIDNKYIVMCDENVSSALMNVILGTVSEADLYANVRLVIETDDAGKITSVVGDSYYIFDNRDIYYYITA